MNELNQAQLERLQATLEQRKGALLSQLASDAEAAATLASSVPEIEASPADNASARTLNDLVVEAAGHKSEQLRLVKYALAKFSDGSYGICDTCGEAIGLSRLNARPEARFCITCQTRIEQAGRR